MKGNVVIPFQFFGADDFENGLATIKYSDDSFGYIDWKGRVVWRSAKSTAPSAIAPYLYEESHPLLAYSGSWTSLRSTSYSGGTMKTLAASGTVVAKFNGTAVTLYATKGSACGIMGVMVRPPLEHLCKC